MIDDGLERGVSDVRTEQDLEVGEQLTRAREEMKLTTSEVAQKLRMSVKQIQALESQRWKEFHSPAILRAFVRSYAKLLNLNVEALMSRLPHVHQNTLSLTYAPSVSAPLPGQGLVLQLIRRSLRWLLLMVFALVLISVISVLWGNWEEISQWSRASSILPGSSKPRAEKQPTPITLQTAPVAQATDSTAVPPAGSAPSVLPRILDQSPKANGTNQAGANMITPYSVLSLKFSGDSWVEIFQSDNSVLARGLQPAGSELNLQGKPPVRLLIGNARQVELRYQGKSINLAPFTGDKVARLTLE